MPIKFTSVGSGLTRSGTYLNANIGGNWGFASWVKVTTLPTGADKLLIWHWGDLTHTNPYIALYWGSSGIYLQVFDGVTTFTSSVVSQQTRYADVWYYLSVRFNSVTTLSFFFNGRQEFTITKDLGTIVFVEKDEYLGTDTGTSLSNVVFEYARTWSGVIPSIGLTNIIGPAGAIEKVYPVAYGTAAADTPLTSSSDLNDISGNSRNWTLIGSASTETVGPLDLVDGEFTDNMNGTPSFAEWTYVPNSAGVAAVGCGGSNAFGCGGNGLIWKGFNTVYSDGALRFMLWPNLSAGTYQVASAGRYNPNATAPFGAVFFLLGDGTARIRLTTGVATSVDFNTAPGVVPVDGTPSAIQFIWHVTSLTQQALLYLNNTLILDTTVISSTGLTASNRDWNMVNLNAPSIGGDIIYDNVELDNIGDETVWNRCTRNRVVNCVVIPVPSNPGSGIYKMVPDKTNDTIYTSFDPETTEMVKIPDPNASLYLTGDE